MKRNLKKYENCILALAVMTVNLFLMGIFFDFYYDLNDDTMMHDIMAGVYSGVPDGRNMQTLYPLGALVALCYRLCRTIPWYGLFLCLCQFGSLFLAGVRLCRLAGSLRRKLAALLLVCLFQWGVCLPHLAAVQYTVACAVMSATAAFLFLTTEDGLTTQQFVVKNIPSVLLALAAFWLRPEMMLLASPFIGLAGLYRMAEEEHVFARENLCKYGAVLGMLLLGMLLSSVSDSAAYGSAEWRDFRDFFDARTTVYDFYMELVTDDVYGGALTELGVMPHQQRLLRNYNFGLDEEIDTRMMEGLAEYAGGTLGAEKDWGAIAKASLLSYRYRIFHGQDRPYNLLALWAYAAVFAAGICAALGQREGEERTWPGRMRRYAFLWQLALLLAVRSAVWLFILMRGRDPERITHSLYLAEFALLLAMLVRLRRRGLCGQSPASGGVMRGFTAVLALGMLFGVPDSVRAVRAGQERREQVNESWTAIDDYCKAHGENFYFEDVYSTVAFSRRMFGGADNGYANYDILGGWMCKSPLYYEKLGHYGIASAGDALLERDNVYLIVSGAEIAENGFEWLAEYYAAQGTAVTVEVTDAVNEYYSVCRVRPVKGNGKGAP